MLQGQTQSFIKSTTSRLLTALLLLSSLSLTNLAAQDAPVPLDLDNLQEGQHYTLISPSVPTKVPEDKVELVEVFSYLCPHCKNFRPHLDEWLNTSKPDQVVYRRVPAQFNPSYKAFAQTYITADTLGLADETHEPLFTAIHEEQRPFRSLEDVAQFYAEFGADKDTFMSTAESFTVTSRLNQENIDVRNYGVRGTPSLIVNGKYLVSVNQSFVTNHDAMIQVADALLKQEIANLK